MTQRLLTLAVFFITMAVGVSILWAATPMWDVTAEIRVASNSPTGDGPSLVSASDVAAYLRSPGLQRDVSDEHASSDVGQSTDTANRESIRRRAQALVHRVRAVPTQLAAKIGAGSVTWSASDSDVAVPHSFVIDTPSEQVVRLKVSANDPTVAEAMAVSMYERVKSELLASEHDRASQRLAELDVSLATARDALEEAAVARSEFQMKIGRQDPANYANHIEGTLAGVRSEQAMIDTQINELQRQQESILARLTDIQQKQLRVVTGDNPRVIQLRSEISGLRAQYASMVKMTDKHPDKKAVIDQIALKEAELATEERTVVTQREEKPSWEYEQLRVREAEIEQDLSGLTARKLGLSESASMLQAELANSTDAAYEMLEIQRAYNAADHNLTVLSAEASGLNDIIRSQSMVSHVSLVETPRVRDPRQPDSPNVAGFLTNTCVVAILLTLVIPTLIAALRGRFIGRWQIEDLSITHHVEVVGEIPGSRMLRLPGRASGGPS